MHNIEFDDVEVHRCPLCGSPQVNVLDFELIKDKFLVTDLECKECKASWSLEGYFNLQRVLYLTDSGGDVIEEVIE